MAVKIGSLLQVHHVAEILDCTDQHVRRLIRIGELPAHRIGKRAYRIQREAVMQYLEEHRVDPEKFYE
jgi:excisionase family DNA binding protein